MLKQSSPSQHEAAQAFARLLKRLDGSDLSPAQAYEQLRSRLLRYFRLHLPWRAEELVDIALDRLARKLGELEIEHPLRYVTGIARHVLQEARAELVRERRVHHEWHPDRYVVTDFDDEDDDLRNARQTALAACLAQLGPASRTLILAYYDELAGSRIQARRRQAAKLGLSMNALRNRAMRLRQALERCLQEKLGMQEHQ